MTDHRRSRLSWCLPLLLVLVGLAAPSGALASGSVTLNGGQLVYTADSQTADDLSISRQNSTLQCSPRPTPCLQFAGDQNIKDQVAGTGCVQVIDIVVACDPALASTISANLGDGDDFAQTFNNAPPTTLNGGPGADKLFSQNVGDALFGEAGNDVLDDSDDTSGGNDLLDGGADNDTFRLGKGNDNVIGGTGNDSAEMTSGDDTVRLDGLANDGVAGEAKNIASDIETIDGGGGGDSLFGNAGANTLLGGAGNDLIDGGDGNDVLEGDAGADRLAGGAGRDRVVYPGPAAQRISLDDVGDDGAPGELDDVHSDVEDVAAGAGDDTIVGSGAANLLDGGDGNDRIDGGGGVDTFLGGAGADTLLARDGLPEKVDCGNDADGGEADTTDALAGCESLALSSALVPDADGDGASKPADCDDNNAAIRPGAADIPDDGIDQDCSGADAVNLDRDGDGSLRPADCIDSNPAIHPGALDIPGNAIDEDCSGTPAPFPLLDTQIGTVFDAHARTVVLATNLRHVHKGSTLRITCHGRGCPRKGLTRRLARNRKEQAFKLPLGKAKLVPGARYEVRVTKPGTVGQVAQYRIRRGQIAARRDRCLAPGAKRPGACPA